MTSRFFILMTMLLALAGCGGGGSDAADNTAPVARAGSDRNAAVGMSVALDGSTSSDADNDTLAYTWTLATAPSGSAAALSGASTARPSLVPDKEGVYALTLSVTDGRSSSTATVKVSVVMPSIVLSQAEPLAGAVRLSLGNEFTGSVRWSVDLQPLGEGGAGVGAPVVWDGQAATNGEHQLVARIQTSATSYQEVRRTVVLSNVPNGLHASVIGQIVSVSSTAGPKITRMSALFDGKDGGTLTAPSFVCTLTHCQLNPPPPLYYFYFDEAAAGSGDHIMVITAEDESGTTRTLSVLVKIAIPPVVALDQPLDGTLAYGRLQLQGTATSTEGGTVRVKARLGDVIVFETTAPSFSPTLDLTGFAPGAYVLEVEADNGKGLVRVERKVVIASSAALAPQPVLQLPMSSNLLAAEADKLLFRADSGEVRVRQISSGAETTLARSSELYYWSSYWQFMAGRVYASADCRSAFACIYAWDEAGVISNLSEAKPIEVAPGSPTSLRAKSGNLLWLNETGNGAPGTFILYDPASGSYRGLGPGRDYGGYDFAVIGGVVHVFHVASTGAPRFLSSVFEWRSDTATSVQLSSVGSENVQPKTDGQRVVWQSTPTAPVVPVPFNLFSAKVGAGAGAILATGVTDYSLADGVLAWSEGRSTDTTLKASSDDVTTTLVTGASSTIFANGMGQVFYTRQGKLYSWDRATRLSTLRLDATPDRVLFAGASVVFVVGRYVYRVPLNPTP